MNLAKTGMPFDLLGHVDRCLALVGQQGFVAAWLDLTADLGADQAMVFSYQGDHAACLMARNFQQARVGQRLALDYLDGWFRQDPLFVQVLALLPGQVEVMQIDLLTSPMSAPYRARFYGNPGLDGKLAILAAGEGLRLAINLYRRDMRDWQPEAAILRVLARLALLHFARRETGGVPDALMALSERERAVCLGVLAGQKAEVIAHALGVAPTSVVTYRRRAYDKLGISSRGELFAICRT
jgi:DNA-binding CsgD family transcriptional regulator